MLYQKCAASLASTTEPARRRHAHHLHAAGVAADEVERDAGGDLGGAVVEGDAAVEDVADGGRHVLDLEDEAERLVAHAAAGAVGHLGVLEMEARLREIRPSGRRGPSACG